MSAMVHRVGENIQVQANVEYERRFPPTKLHNSSYAIFDSGADSCVIGNMAKIVEITKRTASLIGYDPRNTKSESLPIVTALIKTVSKENIPVLLRVHEAVYNQYSNITLLSENQMREHGIIVDS